MKKTLFLLALISLAVTARGQQATKGDIPFKYEELTSPQFVKAVEKAGGVCVIPIGVFEKHGPHLPLGTDLFEAREVAFTAAKKEYAVVFPPYYGSQIFEAKHQPGTIAYSSELIWKMLEETCNELARNGLKKIILLNGHGGNTNFLQFFCQSQLMKNNGYIVVLFRPGEVQSLAGEIKSLKKAKLDGHAGEEETSMMYFIRPDLVDTESMTKESGLDQGRLKQLKYGYTGIWWYASFPNHYAGDVVQANKRLGELLVEQDAVQLAELIKFLKSDNSIERLQEEFFKRAENPMAK
ncbi:MAG TPA: creatininase family protein [Bacteroidales bacterium]|nr:creatininase family protein [Bacteroidales bacterium]HOK74005.1 creatininase family protein [Bacteroidales bacterium]HOM40876.1 creatininase family protein [Bacteroidales bacterium]HOU29702.1 creatininase family protein [Bacteroidales bacterium]HPP91828.1 creatininase family protein [Bacteroidales bacterium]